VIGETELLLVTEVVYWTGTALIVEVVIVLFSAISGWTTTGVTAIKLVF
jgi:hypothetical protein